MHFPWKFSLNFKTALIELYSVGQNSIGENSVGENTVDQNSCRSKFCRSKFCRSKFLSVNILVGKNSRRSKFCWTNIPEPGETVLKSNGVRSNCVSVKWPFGQKLSVHFLEHIFKKCALLI
jgi:hypothetical protein